VVQLRGEEEGGRGPAERVWWPRLLPQRRNARQRGRVALCDKAFIAVSVIFIIVSAPEALFFPFALSLSRVSPRCCRLPTLPPRANARSKDAHLHLSMSRVPTCTAALAWPLPQL
jgi:hypothetical protein